MQCEKAVGGHLNRWLKALLLRGKQMCPSIGEHAVRMRTLLQADACHLIRHNAVQQPGFRPVLPSELEQPLAVDPLEKLQSRMTETWVSRC